MARRATPALPPFTSAWVSSSCAKATQRAERHFPVPESSSSVPAPATLSRRWRPLCLYHTQGKCTLLDNVMHLEKFNHDVRMDLKVDLSACNKLRTQELDYLLILDLEGKVEILEFPVLMMDLRNLELVDSFHRFVRPTAMRKQRVDEYIEGKYGKFGVDRVWHDTAISFREVLEEFQIWIGSHNLWNRDQQGSLRRAAFVTCGNWDLKTKIPEQCEVSRIKLPSYFLEWINLKDIYLNFYNRKATGMMAMMKDLRMPLVGSHHLGIDDAKNIARITQQMLCDGAAMQITARRNSQAYGDVTFLFKNRIR